MRGSLERRSDVCAGVAGSTRRAGIPATAAVVQSTVGLRSASRLPQTDTKVSRQADGLTRKLTSAQNHIAIVGGRTRRTAAPTHPRDREILANMRVPQNAMSCGSSNPEWWY